MKASLLLFLIAPIILSAQPTTTGSISGCVLDDDGKPMNRATIRVLGTLRGGYSKADGTFLIGNLPVGEWQVKVSYAGKHNALLTVVIDSGCVFGLDTILMKRVSRIPCCSWPAPIPAQRWRDETVRTYSREEMLRIGIY